MMMMMIHDSLAISKENISNAIHFIETAYAVINESWTQQIQHQEEDIVC